MREAIVFVGAPGSGKTTQAILQREKGFFLVTREMRRGPKSIEILQSRLVGQSRLVFDSWPSGLETSRSMLDFLLFGRGKVHFMHLTLFPKEGMNRLIHQHGGEIDENLRNLIVTRFVRHEQRFPANRRFLANHATSWNEIDGSLPAGKVCSAVNEAVVRFKQKYRIAQAS